MLKGLAQTVCRLLAAFVCLLCVGEVFGLSASAPPVRGESQLLPAADGDDLAQPGSATDAREEREEREGEGEDDEDDDLDDSRHMPGAAPLVAPRQLKRAGTRATSATLPLRPGHHSLDPKPPRRA